MKYNLYNSITIELLTENKNYIRYFDNEYSLMNSGTDNDTVISLHIVDELPKKRDSDTYRSERFKKLFKYGYIITDVSGNNPKIFFKKHFMDRIYINAIAVFVQAQLLEPIMYLKLLEKNILLMHAAGASFKEHGCLFPAHGGAGKTTTALKMFANGFKLLGDDLLIVDIIHNQVHAYPRPLHLFTYNINSLENMKLPLRVSFVISFKNIIRWLLELITQQEFLISTRVHAHELYSGDIYGSSVPVKKIIFLTKQGEHRTLHLNSDAVVKSVASDIVDSSDLNTSLFENIIQDKEKQQAIQTLEIKVVSELLRQFDTFDYINTRKMDDSDWKHFTSRLKRELDY